MCVCVCVCVYKNIIVGQTRKLNILNEYIHKYFQIWLLGFYYPEYLCSTRVSDLTPSSDFERLSQFFGCCFCDEECFGRMWAFSIPGFVSVIVPLELIDCENYWSL